MIKKEFKWDKEKYGKIDDYDLEAVLANFREIQKLEDEFELQEVPF